MTLHQHSCYAEVGRVLSDVGPTTNRPPASEIKILICSHKTHYILVHVLFNVFLMIPPTLQYFIAITNAKGLIYLLPDA